MRYNKSSYKIPTYTNQSFSTAPVNLIRACVFNGNLAVLVNGCSTEEINIQRGLKQGDPLAPFLFLLVVERLSGTIRKAELGVFKGFKVGNNGLSVSHLQYADDTLFLGEATVENPWTLKTVLRCFELASGLKVNFAKSSVMGVNVSIDFLNLAERFISLGGRVVLLKSVLNSIPIFYLSFLKMPVKVWKQIVRLQRNFLWGGASQNRKIAWVSWDKVCRPKNCGGLGIRDLHAVNLALLGKWRWRVIVGDQGIWRDIILARYGSLFPSPHLGGVQMALGRFLYGGKMFDPGLGGLPLKDRYHRLFQVSNQCLEFVGDMGSWVLGQWFWDFRWKRELSVAEFELFQDLLQVDRLPTRQNLFRRRVFREATNSLCALCGNFVESVDHLFTTCDCQGVGRKSRLGCVLIWHAAVWTIWNSRNDLIFAQGTVSVESLVDKVKLSSWKWFLAKNPGNPCSFYEWEVQPVMCWSR
ncbi:LINE-1 reverse transcriptase like [Trifolium medium]|uniref:LINE-1 reverse transcriptase like n=1 Tax=Trifolium medium TaxID=97028 RepID=A0A392LYP0_9FABA|nr:LINE-1 reverse transcriptase like [Trifolium medium]